MIINVGYALVGSELELVQEVHIEIADDGTIAHIGKGFVSNANIELRNAIAIPALVNAHLHVLDYAFPEYDTVVSSIEEAVAEPHGLKHRLLSMLSLDEAIQTCKKVFTKMRNRGILTTIVFVEIPQMIEAVKRCGKDVGIEAIVLGRPRPSTPVEEVVKVADGLGLDSPLRYSKEVLKHMKDLCRAQRKVISVHVSETQKMHELRDYDLAVNVLDVDIAVHGTHLTEEEIMDLADKGKTVVVCPRSNMRFGVGVPPIAKMLEHRVNMLIGTDNAGVVEPDIWRELELVHDLLRLSGTRIDYRELLKLVTINIEKVPYLGVSNSIEEGKKANIVILDANDLSLSTSRNVYASLVRRGFVAKVLYTIRGGAIWQNLT
jgi:cytosine/adenosine deaminase-related metal-dependent hydrolase